MATKVTLRQTLEFKEQVESQLCSFGERLREMRMKRGWTLEAVACRSGLSAAFLSRLESGGRQASIAAALTLSRVFDVSLASLFESHASAAPCVIVRAEEAPVKNVNGLRYTTLSNAGRFFNLQPIKVTVPVSRAGDEHYRHDGEEWIYVLYGALTLSLAGNRYELKSGDAAHFDSRLPHRLIASGKKDAEVLLVASPVLSPGQRMLPPGSQHRAIPMTNLLTFNAPESAVSTSRESRLIKKSKNKNRF